jgi:hypothetical protein
VSAFWELDEVFLLASPLVGLPFGEVFMTTAFPRGANAAQYHTW